MQMERRLWTAQEDSILSQLVDEIGFSNWTLISLRLSQCSGGSERSGKQCRERWFNHLDQKISKKAWTKNEEKMMFELHQIHGNRWKDLAKAMTNRTENDIKNHFYAFLRKGIRRINRFLGYKKNAKTIRAIKPLVLAKLCEEERLKTLQNKFQHDYEDIFSLIIKFSYSEPNLEEADSLITDRGMIKSVEDFLTRMIHQNQCYLEKKVVRAEELKKKKLRKIKSEELQVKQEIDIANFLNLERENQSSQREGGSSMKEEDLSRKGSSIGSEFENGIASSFSSSSSEVKQEY